MVTWPLSGQARTIAYSTSPFVVKRTSSPVNALRFVSAKEPATTWVGPSPKTFHGWVP